MKRSMTVLAVTVLMALALPARSQQPTENAKSPAAASAVANSNRSAGERAVDPESNRAESEKTSLKSPPGWWDDFSTARQQARTLNKPLLAIFVAAEPYDDSWLPAATAPETRTMIADRVIGTLNYNHEEPAAIEDFGVGKTRFLAVAPTTLVIAPDGAVLARYVGALTAHILQVLVDGATSNVPAVNAEMWLIRKTSPRGEEVAREVRSVFEKSGDRAELSNSLPEAATKILFQPGVVREYSFQHAAEFKLWLDRNDLLAEAFPFPPVCFDHYTGDFPLRQEDQTIPIWTSTLQDPLPNLWVARNPKPTLKWRWRLQANHRNDRLIFDRRFNQAEKIGEDSPPTFQTNQTWVAVSLGRQDVSIFNAYGWPGDEVFRESVSTQGYEVVVAVSRRRKPLELAVEGKLMVPDGVRPIGSADIELAQTERLVGELGIRPSLGTEILDEARREQRRSRSAAVAVAEPNTVKQLPRGRNEKPQWELPTGWSSDADAAMDAAKAKKVPVIVAIDAPRVHAEDRKRLESAIGREVVGQELAKQFEGVFFYVSPFDELWRQLGVDPLPSMLAFDGDGKLLGKPVEGVGVEQLKDLIAQAAGKLATAASEGDSSLPKDSPQQTTAAEQPAAKPAYPARWHSSLDEAKEAAKQARLPLVVMMADPAQSSDSQSPLIKLVESPALERINHEFIGHWHYSGPFDDLWQKHQLKTVPWLLVFDADGNLLEGPIEEVSLKRLSRAVASAVEKVVPMHAELWIVKSDLTGLADAAATTQQLKDAYEKAHVAPELVEKLPATASQLLFPPEVTMQFSAAEASRLKAWLKNRQILEEVLPVAPFHFLMNRGIGGGLGETSVWLTTRTEPYSWTKLPEIDVQGTVPAFVDRNVEWTWEFQGNPMSGISSMGRYLFVHDHFRGDPKPAVQETLDSMDLSLPHTEAVILNGFPQRTDTPVREALRRQGREIVVVASRSPLIDSAEPSLLLPERVSPLISRPQSTVVYNWNAVVAGEFSGKSARKPDPAGASAPQPDQPADEAISKSGKLKHYQTPNGWYSDFFEAAKAAQEAQLPIIMIVTESTGDAMAQLKPAIDLPAVQQALGQQFIGVVAAVGPTADLDREFEIKATPAILAFDPTRKLIGGPTTDATPVTMANVLAEVLKKVEPFHAELWFVKSDASQLPDANRIAVSVKALLARMKAQTPLADQLPKSATEILFPGGVSLQYTRENAGQLKAWLQRNRLLTRVEPLVDQDVTGLFTFVSTPGPVNVSMTAAVQPASILPLSIPFVADPRPQVKRRAEWWWLLNSEPFAPGFRDPAALRPGDASLTVELHINNYFQGQHAPKTDRLLERFGMRLPHAEVVLVNSFKRNGVSKLARSADAADENAIVVITPSHWRSEKTNEFAPLPTLPENVTPLKAENTVDQLANYIASVDPADNNSPGDGDHSLQVAQGVIGGEEDKPLQGGISEEEAKLMQALEKAGPNHPTTPALQELLQSRRVLRENAQASLPPIGAADKGASFKIFYLKHSRAAELATTLKKLFDDGRSDVVVDERTNSLIVRGQDKPLSEIEELLRLLDVEPIASSEPKIAALSEQQANLKELESKLEQAKSAENGPRIREYESRVSEARMHLRKVQRLSVVTRELQQAQATLGPDHPEVRQLEKELAELRNAPGMSESETEPMRSVPERSKPELANAYQGREHRAGELANRIKAGVPANEAERLKGDVSQAVTEAFAARQSLLRAELAELKSRLQVLERTIETRDKLQAEIVKKRVNDLLNPDLKWDGDSSDDVRSKPVAGGQPGRGAPSQSPAAEEQVVYVEGQNEEPGYWIRNPKPSEFADAALEPREVGVVQSPREATDIRISLARTDSVKLHEWLVVRSQPSGEGFGRARPLSIATIEVVDVQPDHAIAHVIGFNRVRNGNSYQNQSPTEGDTVHRPRNVAIQSDGDVRDSHFDPARLHDAFKTTQSPSRDQNRGGTDSSGRMGSSGRMAGAGFGGRRSSRDAASYERRIAGVISEVKGYDQISVSLAARDNVKPGDRLNVAETPDPAHRPENDAMMSMMAQRSASAGMSIARPVATIEVVSAQGDTAVCKVITINRVREENRFVDKLPEPGDTVLFLPAAHTLPTSAANEEVSTGENARVSWVIDPVGRSPVQNEEMGVVTEAADAANVTVSLARRNVIKIGDQLVAVDGSNGTQAMMPGMSSMGSMGGYGGGPRTPPPTQLATLEVIKLDDGTAICRVKSFHRVREGNAYVDKLPKPGDPVLFFESLAPSVESESKSSQRAPAETGTERPQTPDRVILMSGSPTRWIRNPSPREALNAFLDNVEMGSVTSVDGARSIVVSLKDPATIRKGDWLFVCPTGNEGLRPLVVIQVDSIQEEKATCHVLAYRRIREGNEYANKLPAAGDGVYRLSDKQPEAGETIGSSADDNPESVSDRAAQIPASNSPTSVDLSRSPLPSDEDLKLVNARARPIDFDNATLTQLEAGLVASARDADHVNVILADPSQIHVGDMLFVQNAERLARKLGERGSITAAIKVTAVEGTHATCEVAKFRRIRYDGDYREVMPCKGDILRNSVSAPPYTPGTTTPPVESRTPPEPPALGFEY